MQLSVVLILCFLAVSQAFLVRNPHAAALSQYSRRIPNITPRMCMNEPISKDSSNRLQNEINFPERKLLGVNPTLLGLGGAALLSLALNQPAMASDIAQLSSVADSSGFLQSFLLIFISEIGDKTFFIAGLLAAKYGRLISFSGSVGALAVMTVISTVLGQIFHSVPSSLTQGIPFDDYIAVAAFTYFGVKTLIDSSKIEGDDSSGIEEEKAEAEELVEEVTKEQKFSSVISLLIQTFSLVFAAEIGDRSFLSTIALSAALNPFAVAAGAIAAHASATGIAVLGGALMSKYLSEKVIGYIGGTLFIVFAITTATGLF